jgi:Histidine kinase-, DNA gyrase B-, and HSP90-like ATPase
VLGRRAQAGGGELARANAQAGTVIYLMDSEPGKARTMAGGPGRHHRRGPGGTQGHRRPASPGTRTGFAPGTRPRARAVARPGRLVPLRGLAVTITTEGEPQPLPTGTDLSAYRIIQEALTNVTKHATAGQAQVTLAYTGDQLRITVTNDSGDPSPGAAAVAPSSGYGLIGMRERALSVGGRLRGPPPGGRLRSRHRTAAASQPPAPGAEPVTIRVLLADDQALLRQTFRILITPTPEMEVVGEAADGKEATQLTRATIPTSL